MGKKESKSFRERLGIKRGKSGIKTKDDMRQISVSEMELLSSIYAEREIKAAEKRIDKRIAKRNKRNHELSSLQLSSSDKREYQYARIIPENGIINKMGITEKQFNDPSYEGHKEKYMVSAYKDGEGNSRLIRVETKGDFTQEEKKEIDRIMRAKQDLEKMQKAFEEEEK